MCTRRSLALASEGLDYVNYLETESELKSLRHSAWGGMPFGNTAWQQTTAKRLGLESTLRFPGHLRSTKSKK